MLSLKLLENIHIIYKSENYHDSIEIDYISDDSNDIKTNTCFVCIEGSKVDSHQLIDQLAIEPSLIISNKQLDTNIPYIIVCNTKIVLSQISKNFFNNPSHHLNIIGTTGTDGKTTTSLIVRELLGLYGKSAYIGTNGFITDDFQVDTKLTTPKPIYLNRYLKRCVNDGVEYVALEASSQGLNEHRLDDIRINRAIFTNLTHEHLDYHKSMENYFQAKMMLFKHLPEDGYAIVNNDLGDLTKRIKEHTKAKTLTYGRKSDSDFYIYNIESSLYRTTFSLKTPKEDYKRLHINLFGDYNVYNVVGALAVVYSYGHDLELAIRQLSHLHQIDGRMKVIDDFKSFKVIVDFAHTPNALKALLSNIHQMPDINDIIIVFGSAGERDKLKRPIMGQVASTYCDKIILTNEDPKSEEPIEIIRDIYKGIETPMKTRIILNRKEAIKKAISLAKENDVVLITGKGNENIQMFDHYHVSHNDIDVTLELLHQMPNPIAPFV